MNKNLLVVLGLVISVAVLSSSFVSKPNHFSSFTPPQTYTGALGYNCSACHGGNTVNNAGGSIVATGLPTSGYTAGAEYNFDLTLTHTNADRARWGFSMAARNSAGDPVGTFSTVDPDPNVNHAAVNGNDFSHYAAPFTSSQSSYTFSGLKWTAPASPGPNDANVTFYYVGNAANGTGATDGDFIYTNSTAVTLPVILSAFEASVFNKNSALLTWRTESEINTDYFSIEKSEDGINFTEISRVKAKGNTTTAQNYSFEDIGRGIKYTSVKYRLKTVDFDGKKSYSIINQVLFDSFVKFIGQPIPNPVGIGDDHVQFEIVSDKMQVVNLNVFSTDSKLLQRKTIPVIKGRNIFILDISKNMESGLKIASFTIGDKSQQVPFMVYR